MSESARLTAELDRAHLRLVEKRLLVAEDDAVSVRLPGTNQMLYRTRHDAAARAVALSEASGLAALHARVLELRLDAGAVASVSTRSSAALVASGSTLPIVFDEQARHIGQSWPSTSAPRLAAALASGANAGAVDARWLVLGVTPSRMIFNVELFEKSAQAYLLARGDGAGRKTHRVPWWVCWIAGRRLRRDQRNAARHHAEGRSSPELVAY